MKERFVHRQKYWKRLLDYASEKTNLHSNISPGKYSWVGTSSGVVRLSYNYIIKKHEARVELYIDKGKKAHEENERIYNELLDQKEKIQEAFGSQLSWEKLESERACRIAKYIKTGGYSDEEKWDNIIEETVDIV
ncbi:DUF4268 domain-containing protein [Fodinibius salinus]|uniref:DUF4268 domain-containing protein n=1 Tax=Fodinibius salinus TaxID=860790 RepID=UPI0011E7C539